MSRPTCRRRRAILTLHPLEDRAVPAGVVNATFAAGVLTLTAVNDPTDVNVTNANHQNITLDGAGGNTITVIANDGETGTAFTRGPFAGVTSLRLVMGLGNDTVTLTDAALPGTVTFLGGSGNNRLRIDGVGNFTGVAGPSPGDVTVRGVAVTNGDGSDTFAVGGGTHAITGNVTIANGVGDSITAFGAQPGDVTSVGGTLRVTNLTGVDTFQAVGAAATFTGPITISNGHGNTDTDFRATTNTLTGGLAVTNGFGNDLFATGGSSFTVGTPAARRNLTLVNGTGTGAGAGAGNTDQNFDATTNTINGNVSVTALAGDDDFSVGGDTFRVLGGVKVSTGTGGGTTSISPAQEVDIDGPVAVTAGEGNDTLRFGGNARVDLASVSLSTGNGQSTLDFNGGPTTVTGTVTHTHLAGNSNTRFNASAVTVKGAITSTHGDGNDTFDLGGANFTAAAITIRNGAGTGTTRLDASNATSVLGNISVTNGDGFDTFATGGSAFTLGTPAARRNLTINNGVGGSDTLFNAGTNTVHGNIGVTNADGADEFDVSGGVFAVTGAGSVTIADGVGASDVFIDANTSNAIGGRLTVTAADGDRAVQLERLTVTGITSITTGSGNDTVEIDNSVFDGTFRLATGAGADQVRIEDGDENDGVSTVFNAAARVDAGGGDDQVLIGVVGDADDFGAFNAAVTLIGGPDLDILLALGNAANTFAVPPTVTGFEQGT